MLKQQMSPVQKSYLKIPRVPPFLAAVYTSLNSENHYVAGDMTEMHGTRVPPHLRSVRCSL